MVDDEEFLEIYITVIYLLQVVGNDDGMEIAVQKNILAQCFQMSLKQIKNYQFRRWNI